MIHLVLFDIDGTLIRTGGAGVKAFERTLAVEFGLPNATRNVNFAGRTDTSLVGQFFQTHQIGSCPENFCRFFSTYVFFLEAFLQQCHGGACLGVREFICDLQALRHRPLLGLLTGNIRLGAEIKLRHYGLWHCFQTGAFGDDDENRNRLAAIARARGEELLGRSLAGDEILVVGDTPLDVQCAKAIGAQMLAVGTGGFSCDELRQCNPTWVVETLLQSRADEVCVSGPCKSLPTASVEF